MVTKKMGRGIRVYKGNGAFGKKGYATDTNILFTVITRLEISKLKTEIEPIDSNAIIIMRNIRDPKGGMIRKGRLVH